VFVYKQSRLATPGQPLEMMMVLTWKRSVGSRRHVPQLGAQPRERLSLRRRDGGILEAIEHCELQIGHAASRLERQEGATAVERHDLNPRQFPEHGPVHNDERLAFRDGDELDVGLDTILGE
jgi:hypothetical protein